MHGKVVMRVFVPLEDGPLDGDAGVSLVPYRCGLACAHALRSDSVDASQGAVAGALIESVAAAGASEKFFSIPFTM
jgi:hypothetical protein